MNHRLHVALWAIVFILPSVSGTCPWQLPDLTNWSDPATWGTLGIPAFNSSVTIPADKKILMDTAEIPRLLSLTIDGVLVWGDVDNIRLETSYVLVNGEFHIGSEDCRFEKNADIFLYGKSDSPQYVPGPGRKFIEARSGSTLEMHGQEKLSWSKLVQTVSPARSSPCGSVYDSRDYTLGERKGFHVHVWDKQGNLVAESQYRTSASDPYKKSKNMNSFLEGIADGNVVAIAVFRTMGNASLMYDPLFTTIENLGGWSIRYLREYEPYVLIAEKGNFFNAVESLESRGQGVMGAVQTSASLDIGDLTFQATSISYNDNYNDQAIFQVITFSAAYPTLSLLHDVSTWLPGDEVVVTSTDFNWRQAEVRKIVACPDCASNQVRVQGEFVYTHFGEVTYGVDERAEVGLLSRNIRIEAELQKECYSTNDHEAYLCELFNKDTFGGHTKVRRGAFARIEGVQLTNMGQQALQASYPLHFHFCDAVPGQYLRNNVIRDSNSRCITIHTTDHLEVSNNVCYNHLGHGIFLEDSAEQNNTIHRNLVIGTQFGTLLLTDMDEKWCEDPTLCNLLSSYWITHPNNIMTDNVAAGSDTHGIVLAFSDQPIGYSLQHLIDRGLFQYGSTRYMPVKQFSGNVMHSNSKDGLWFDTRISHGFYESGQYYPVNAKAGPSLYAPRDPPNVNGTYVETVISQLTIYKNNDRNAWVRCGNIVVEQSSFADAPISFIGANSDSETSCDVRNSVFIGETDNKGEPLLYYYKDEQFQDLPKSERPFKQFDRSFAHDLPDGLLHGVAFYQGPTEINNCFFDRYFNWYFDDAAIPDLGYRPVRPGSAFGFHPSNQYPMIPTNRVKNITFGFCDGEADSYRLMNGNASTPNFKVDDGTLQTNFRDSDGSINGLAQVQIVQNRPFFTDVGCLSKPDWGNMAVCRRQYFQLVIRGDTGVLQYQYREHYPVLISKDAYPEDVYRQSGSKGHKFVLSVNRSYTVRFNDTLGPAPRDMLFRPRYGLQQGELVRLAVCLPSDTTQFKVRSAVLDINSDSGKIQWVDNLPALDADTSLKAFFWDQVNGYLYFKLTSPYTFDDPSLDLRCPGNECVDLTITRLDGSDEPAVCDSPVVPYVTSEPEPDVLVEDVCHGKTTMPKGLGASIEPGFLPPPSSQCVS